MFFHNLVYKSKFKRLKNLLKELTVIYDFNLLEKISIKSFNMFCFFSKYQEPLHKHLRKNHIEFLQFAFRWMNNLLMREIPLQCTIRLWDTYHVILIINTLLFKQLKIYSFILRLNRLASQIFIYTFVLHFY